MHPLDELKAWVGFGPGDEARLAAFWPRVRPSMARLLDAFYAPVLQTPRARAVLEDEAQIERLRAALAVWLEEMLVGPFDLDWYERRARIGRVHVQFDLPSRFMPVSMSVLRHELVALARDTLSGDDLWETVASIERITGIELAIMTGTYVEEQQIVELSALRDLIVSHMPVTVMVVEKSGRIVAATGPASRLTGDVAIVGRRWDEALPAALIEASDLGAQLERASRTGREITLLRVDAELAGILRSFRITVVPLDHPLAAALLHLEELTEAVETEARLRRTEAMARLGEMSAAVAHELRNPLAGVSGAIQIIGRGLAPSDPRKPIMEKIEHQLFRLNALVSDLLAFARPGMPVPTRIDLLETARRGVDDARRLHPGPVFEVEGGGFAWADAGHVDQILQQLLENAAQAAPKGRVRVGVAPGEITVTDDGPGVPEADRARIFEPFYTTRTRGTGLGLPIAQRLALAMSGDLRLGSSGPGATFVLRLAVSD